MLLAPRGGCCIVSSLASSVHVKHCGLLLSMELLLLPLMHDLLVLSRRHHHWLLIVLIIAGSVLHYATSSVLCIHLLFVEESAVSNTPARRLIRAIKLTLIVLSAGHCSWIDTLNLLWTWMPTYLAHSYRGGVRVLHSVCVCLSCGLHWDILVAILRSYAELLVRRGTRVQCRMWFLSHTFKRLPKAILYLLLEWRCLRGKRLLRRAITSCRWYLFSLLLCSSSLFCAAKSSNLLLFDVRTRWGSLTLAVFGAFLEH